METIDMLGRTFGKLVVAAYAHKNAQGRIFWGCHCVCGNTCVVSGTNLRCGTTQSCGCYRSEASRTRATTHGGSKSPEYASWTAMMHRCYDPKRGDYAYYGGSGITVCRRWHKFENFQADMAPRPPGMTLERTRNTGSYSPSNCEWVDRHAQAQNRRNTVLVTHEGRTQNMAQWARELGVSYGTLNWRRHRGWTDAQIINGNH